MNNYLKYKYPKYLEVTKNFLEEKYGFHFNSTNYSPCVLHDEKKGTSFQIYLGEDKREIRLHCKSGRGCTINEKQGVETCDIYDVVLELDEECTSSNDAYVEVKKYFDSHSNDVSNTYWSPFQNRKPLKEKKSSAKKVEDLSDLSVFDPWKGDGYPPDEYENWELPSIEEVYCDLTRDAHYRLMYEDEDKVKKARKFMKEQGFWDEKSKVIKAILKELWIGYTDYIYNTPVCGEEPVEVNRIVFPLFDENGKIKARQFGNPNAKSKRWMFSKHAPIGKLLYGFHETKNHIKERKEVYLFEGVKDFLNAIIFDWGKFKNSVATFSCHVTDDQMELLMKCKLKKIIFAYDPDKAGRMGMVRAIRKFKEQDPNLEFSYYVYPNGTDAGDAYNTTNPSIKKSFNDYLKDIVYPSSLFGEHLPKGKTKKEQTSNSIAYVVDLGKDLPKELIEEVFEDTKGVYKAYKINTDELKKKLHYPSSSNANILHDAIEDIVKFIKSQPIVKSTKKDRDKEFHQKCAFIDSGGYKSIGTGWILLLMGSILQKEHCVKYGELHKITQKELAGAMNNTRQTIRTYFDTLLEKNYIYIKKKYNTKYPIFCIDPKRKRKSR